MELEKGHLQYIIEHVFLPPKLPQSYDAEIEQKDESLYKFVAEASEYFVEALEVSPHGVNQRDLQLWQELNKMLECTTRVHELHRLTKEDIETALQQLEVGGKSVQFLACDHTNRMPQSLSSSSYCRPECGHNFSQGGD
jgi:hypothetical protein